MNNLYTILTRQQHDEFRGSEKYDIAYHHAIDDFVNILNVLEMYG